MANRKEWRMEDEACPCQDFYALSSAAERGSWWVGGGCVLIKNNKLANWDDSSKKTFYNYISQHSASYRIASYRVGLENFSRPTQQTIFKDCRSGSVRFACECIFYVSQQFALPMRLRHATPTPPGQLTMHTHPHTPTHTLKYFLKEIQK